MKGSIFSEDNMNFPDGQKLHTLVLETEKLVDTQKTRLDLLEEEAAYFKTSYHNISKEYQRVKGQFESLAQRMAHEEPKRKVEAQPRISKLSSFNSQH